MRLTIFINHTERSARFHGDTFDIKEDIKALGRARWLAAEKMWEVRGLEIEITELRSRFPEAQFEETGNGEAAESIPVNAPPASPETAAVPQGLSVQEVLRTADKAIRSAFPVPICVYGILRHIKRYGERTYLELGDSADSQTRIHGVIWNNRAQIERVLKEAGFELEVDLEVMFEGTVAVRPKDGSLSFTILRVIPEYSLAKVLAKREATNRRLKAEGLFEKNKLLPLPFLPVRLGVLTSSGGTVIHDFLAPLEEINFGFEISLFHVQVQGADAKTAIARGIRSMGQRNFDLLLLFRGGGSPAELAVFSEYEVAKEICLCPVPVFSAIGHQADLSSAQDVSARAFGVPKELGISLATRVTDLRRQFGEYGSRIFSLGEASVAQAEERRANLAKVLGVLLSRVVEIRHEHLLRIAGQLPLATASALSATARTLQRVAEPLAMLAGRMGETASERLRHTAGLVLLKAGHAAERTEATVALLSQRIEDASPEVQLRRGFSLVWDAGTGKVVTDGKSLKPGEEVDIEFRDVRRQATISANK